MIEGQIFPMNIFFLNGNAVFKNSEFPHGILLNYLFPIGKNEMLCFELAQPKLKYFALSN